MEDHQTMDKSNIGSDMWQGCVTGAKRKKNHAIKKGDLAEASKQLEIEKGCKILRDKSKK